MFRVLLVPILLGLLSQGLMAKGKQGSWSRDEIRAARETSDAFRKSYKFDKETFETVRSGLDGLVDIQKVISEHELSADLMKGLNKHKDELLKGIVNLDKQAVPYLIREHANLQIDRNSPNTTLVGETAQHVNRMIDSRIAAVEAALKAIGLNAIPSLSDFQATASRKKANTFAMGTRSLIDEIVRQGSIEAQKTQMRLMMAESQKMDELKPDSQRLDVIPAQPPTAMPETPASELGSLPSGL